MVNNLLYNKIIKKKRPCLSLDVIIPEHNAQQITQPTKTEITEYPLTVYVVAGTQASKATDNSVFFMKWSQLHKTYFDDEEEIYDEEGIEVDDEPLLNVLAIKHPHPINRIRSMNGSSVVALWDETGSVSIYDGTKHIKALAEYNEEVEELMAEDESDQNKAKKTIKPPKDTQKNNFLLGRFQHALEGYALQWSPHTLGNI